MKNAVPGAGEISVSQEPEAHAWGPEFDPDHPHQKPSVVAQDCNLGAEDMDTVDP